MAETTHAVDSQFEWGVRRDVSHRGAEPSVCYEILLLGPRGAHIRTLARTPRRRGRTEDADMASAAQMMAASRILAAACEAALDYLRVFEEENDEYGRRLGDTLRSALAKARGSAFGEVSS